MDAIFSLYRTLVVAAIGLSLLFGVFGWRTARQKIGMIVVRALMLPLAVAGGAVVWSSSGPGARFLTVLVGVPLLLAWLLVRKGFVREVAAGVVANAVYDGTRRPGCFRGLALLLLALAVAAALS